MERDAGTLIEAGGATSNDGTINTPDAGSGNNATATCYPADDTVGGAPECLNLEICITKIPDIAVNPDNCQPGLCAWTYQVNLGDTLTFENDQGWLLLRFSQLPESGSTADLRNAFEHLNFYAKFPLRGSTTTANAIYFDYRTSPDDFDLFEVTNGRLHVRVSFAVSYAYTTVLSKPTICGDTDNCPCTFGGVTGNGVFDVDLPYTQ